MSELPESLGKTSGEGSRELPPEDVTRDQTIRLLTFLKELAELRFKAVRDLSSYERVLWLEDLPKQPECTFLGWEEERASEEENWLSVRRPELEAHPAPPSELLPWIRRETLSDCRKERPLTYKSRFHGVSEIDVKTHEEMQRREEIFFHGFPDLAELFETYVEEKWNPWKVRARPKRDVQDFYAALYEVHQRSSSLGEQYELLVGFGLLAWKDSTQQRIYRHLVAIPVETQFDSQRGILSLAQAGDGRLRLEEDMLEPSDRPRGADAVEIGRILGELEGDVWNQPLQRNLLAGWANAVASDGEHDMSLQRPAAVSECLNLSLTPAIILRKRQARSYIGFTEALIRLLEDGMDLPRGLADFIGGAKSPIGTHGRSEAPAELPGDNEVYFPLEANAEQRRIVERMANDESGLLVQGPPGTGKSHTIVNLICHLLATGQRVLVTSEKTRALRVIQRFLETRAPEVAPLTVALVEDDRKGLANTEGSVESITARHYNRDRDKEEQAITRLRAELGAARRDQSEARNHLLEIREKETQPFKDRFGYRGTLARISEQLTSERAQLGWLPDRPAESAPEPITKDCLELVGLLRQDLEIEGDPPDTAKLPPVNQLRSALSDLSEADDLLQNHDLDGGAEDLPQWLGASEKLVAALAEKARTALSSVQANAAVGEWQRAAMSEVLSGQNQVWSAQYEESRRLLGAVTSLLEAGPVPEVSLPSGRSLAEIEADASDMSVHLVHGGSWGFGPFKKEVAKRASYLRSEAEVDGRGCGQRTELQELLRFVRLERRFEDLESLWSQHVQVDRQLHKLWLAGYEPLAKDLGSILEAVSGVEDLETELDLHGLKLANLDSLGALENTAATARAVEALQLRGRGEKKLQFLQEALEGLGGTPTTRAMATAVEGRDEAHYSEMSSVAADEYNRYERRMRRDDLEENLAAEAPRLAEALRDSSEDPVWDVRLQEIGVAFRWAQAREWIRRLADPKAQEDAQRKLEIEQKRERRLLSELAGALAWRECFDRMTEDHRESLVAWSKAVRNLGKGTGKHAFRHRLAAREHLGNARGAIPGWIMPLYRVVESIEPGQEPFDVVIIDEASQSGPDALVLLALAKKIVVVGDDKQISPSNVGLNRDSVDELRGRLIPDLKLSKDINLENSLFDLADIKFPGRIPLVEHFRCMPEIINFCNLLCYQQNPLVPLKQYGADRLSPVLSRYYVSKGYREGSGQRSINEPEAEELVQKIVECCEDPAYEGKTLGMITLLGDGQARHVEKLLIERLGPEAMEERDLLCGNAFDFQGDERDVMFLSMVASSEGRNNALTADMYKRRFNVAVSRAREQVFLFHSVTENDLSPQCLRRRLLEYVAEPSVEHAEGEPLDPRKLQLLSRQVDRASTKPPDPFESWFELEVFVRIAEKGFRAVPQYSIAGYRVDLLLQGLRGRLAVECDGDFWHGRDRYLEDMARQRDLERCGLPFWRVRESAFYANPKKALDSLWEALDVNGIRATAGDRPDPPEGHLSGLSEAEPESPDRSEQLARDESDQDGVEIPTGTPVVPGPTSLKFSAPTPEPAVTQGGMEKPAETPEVARPTPREPAGLARWCAARWCAISRSTPRAAVAPFACP